MYDLSLVIVNYKMADYIKALLISVMKELAVTPLSVHIVIVDNNSNDHIEDVVSGSALASQITLIKHGKNPGMAGGVNIGLRAVTARYYFIINPDIVFTDPATLFRLTQWMDRHPKVGMAAPKLLNADGTLQYSCWRFPSPLTPLYRRTRFGKTARGAHELSRFLMKEWDHARTQPVDCIMGSAMLVRHEALQRVGFMSEEYFMYFEDIDWCRRFWRLQVPVYYIHDIVLTHHHQRDSAKVEGLKALLLNRMTRVHVRSWIKYMWKWRGVAV